jgi:RimJ/RimL family protein N-acetyltransferase
MFQDIVTARLILRDLEPADAEIVFRYRSDPQVSRYISILGTGFGGDA